jgi:hypothetical protein
MSKLLYLIKKMLGMTSLTLAIMGVFTPILTIYVVWFSIIIAGFSGLVGSLLFSMVAILINLINLFFLSPISLSLIGGNFFSMIVTLMIFIGSLGAWSLGLKLKLSGMMEEPKNHKSRNTKL